MKLKISEIISTATFRQSVITVSGTLVNGALGVFFYILAARLLGPEKFGLVSVSIVVLTMLGDIFDWGVNTTLVRFVAKYLKTEPSKANKFLKLSLVIKFLSWLFVLVLGFLLSSFIAKEIFQKPELLNPLRISFVGVGGALFFTFILSTLQAYQKFLEWSLLQISTNFLRLILIIFLFLNKSLFVESTLIVYVIMPFLGFFLGTLLIERKFILEKNYLNVKKELFGYSKWVSGFILVAAVSGRLDTFISARLLSAYEIGIYSAATQLVQIFPQIISALGAVFSPKIASMQNFEDMISYFKKSQMFVVGISFLGLFLIPASSYLIPFVFGESYRATVAPFIFLVLAMLIFLISIPMHNLIFYYFERPDIFLWLSLANLAIMITFGWNLIRAYGVIGAAFSVILTNLFNFVVPAIWVLREVKRKR